MTLAPAHVIALEGAHVVCPNCKATIGSLRKTLYQGWTVGLDAFEFVKGQEPVNDQAACRNCGASYCEHDIRIRQGRKRAETLIHTSYGWFPRPPPNAPASPRKPIKPAA